MLPPRFWSKVDRSGDCWLWTAAKFSNGYGAFREGANQKRAHRVAWEHVNGPIPSGLVVCHSCDVKHCVRLSHLFLGTQADNIADRDAKGHKRKGKLPPRPHGVGKRKGERHPRARLTERQVREIRTMYASGEWSYHTLAAQFGVAWQTVESLVSRRNWKHVC